VIGIIKSAHKSISYYLIDIQTNNTGKKLAKDEMIGIYLGKK